MVEEAHRNGVKVEAHAHGLEGILAAVRAGVDSIEHRSMLNDEGLRLMKERGTFLRADALRRPADEQDGRRNVRTRAGEGNRDGRGRRRDVPESGAGRRSDA